MARMHQLSVSERELLVGEYVSLKHKRVLLPDQVVEYTSRITGKQPTSDDELYSLMEAIKFLLMHVSDDTVSGHLAAIIASQIPLHSALDGASAHETF